MKPEDFEIKDGTVLQKYHGTDTDVIIPEGIKKIYYSAFGSCKDIQSVVIPEGVTEIGKEAFFQCKSLSVVSIPLSVSSIGDQAFYGCDALKEITIPGEIKHLGKMLTEPWADTKFNILHPFRIENNALVKCFTVNEKTILIPKEVTIIGDWAFKECNIEQLIIPETVSELKTNAFCECEIKELHILNPRISFELAAFQSCKGMEKIVVPENSVLLEGDNLTAILYVTNGLSVILSIKKNDGGLIEAPISIGADVITPFEENKEEYDQLLAVGRVDNNRMNETMRIQGIIYRYKNDYESVSATNKQAFANFLSEKINVALKYAFKEQDPELINVYNTIGAFNVNNIEKVKKSLKKQGGKFAEIADSLTFQEPDNQAVQDVQISSACKKIIQKEKWNTKLARYRILDINGVKMKDGSDASDDITKFLFGALMFDYDNPGFVKKVADEIEAVSFLNAVQKIYDEAYFKEKADLARPIMYFTNDEDKVTEIYRTFNRSKFKDNVLTAILMNKTRTAAMIADKEGILKEYAKQFGLSETKFRDKLISDIGLNAKGEIKYDLGNQTVTVRLLKDMSFEVWSPVSKETSKSIPKKNADPEKYEKAVADFDRLKKDVKKVLKNRKDLLFEEFLHPVQTAAAIWKNNYLKNPVLNAIASLIVWKQGTKTFIVKGKNTIDYKGNDYSLKETKIMIAHPMDMNMDERIGWERYFTENNLKQPFPQIWEPVIDFESVKEDRYRGINIPFYRFMGMEKHGIKIEDNDHHNEIEIMFEECSASVNRVDFRRHDIKPEDNFEIESFQVSFENRMSNHIVGYLDKVTVYERILKDDIQVVELLPNYNVAQICDFIGIATKNNSQNVLAALLEYKNNNFSDYSTIDEFVLDI